MKHLNTPLTKKDLLDLKVGDEIVLSGYIYTARDQAHKRLNEMLKKNEKLPFNLEGQLIYYVGPTPAKGDELIGSCGPTSSYRMDELSEALFEQGLVATIGKGNRSDEFNTLMKKYNGIYFLALGGAGALISTYVVENEIVAFEDLGAEAIRRLKVMDLQLIVGIDSNGDNIYEESK
jgi:fumarate hydratase subunit beta